MSAYNGAGTFVISGAGLPVVTGTTISSTVQNQLDTDLATGLSNAICKDGQTTPTANIPMANFKITGLAAPTVAGDAICYPTPGTWTPTDASGAGLVFTNAFGRSVKLGPFVMVSGAVTFPATADTNSVAFGSLPYTASNAVAANLDGLYVVGTDAARLDTLQIQRNSTQILLRNTSASGVQNSVYSGKSITFSGVYIATA